MPQLTIPQSLRRGLVAYWPLDELSGARSAAMFLSNPANLDMALAASGAVGNTTGPSNNLPIAANFPGTINNYLNVAAANAEATLGGKGSFHGWGWFKVTDTLAAYIQIAQYSTAGTTRSWEMLQPSGVAGFVLQTSALGGGTVAATTLVAATNGVWHFVHWYFDSERGKQGVSVDLGTPSEISQTAVFSNPAVKLTIGASHDNAGYTKGQIAHVGLRMGIMSAQERSWLYNNGQGRDLRRAA